jgi:predicted CoA-substrate-specific enzyme activase
MITAGVDVGAETVKVVIFKDQELAAWSLLKTELDRKESVDRALKQAEERGGISKRSIRKLVATGIGRKTIAVADDSIPDIIASGRGAAFLFPNARTVIDIGAEEARAIRLGPDGEVENFTKNDKCAAGVGAFLEAMARALELSVEEMGPVALRSQQVIPMNSICAVFAESEVVSLIHSQIDREDIARSIHESIAVRIVSMIDRVGVAPEIAFIGGVARNAGVVASLCKHLKTTLLVPEHPQLVTAMGAALLAQDG